MAKTRTTQNEDDLSVISLQIKKIQAIVQNIESETSKMEQNKALYSDLLEKERTRSTEALKSVISQEIGNLKGVSNNIISLEHQASENIHKSTLKALQEVKNSISEKTKTSKQMIWTLCIGGILVALATMAVLGTRIIDQKTIEEAVQTKALYENRMNDLKQWAQDNPRDAKSFNRWVTDRAEK